MMGVAALLSARFSLVNFAGRLCSEKDRRTGITSHTINSVALFYPTKAEQRLLLLSRELARLLVQALVRSTVFLTFKNRAAYI
jgi:hypothetical protein